MREKVVEEKFSERQHSKKIVSGPRFCRFLFEIKELLSKSKVVLNEGHDPANIIFNLGVNYLWVIYHQRFPILGEAPQINIGVGMKENQQRKTFHDC